MNKETYELTAYCGIYCGDCIHYKNKHSNLARNLIIELNKVGFNQYAAIESPFGNDFKHYREFITVLNALAKHYCDHPCRVGNGCSPTPCPIIKCCQLKDFEGCWECHQIDSCKKFEFLEPRCGDTPKNNLRKIKDFGLDNWVKHKEKFYVWL